MDLSICIVSMNHRSVLEDCLRSLLEVPHQGLELEVIVVDNCSTDGTRELLKEWSKHHAQLEVLLNKRSQSFAVNNNIAFRHARGTYVLALNPDTIVRPGALEFMVRYLQGHPDVGAATCKLVYGDGRFQASARRFPRLKYLLASRLSAWGVRRLDRITDQYVMSKPEDTTPKEVDYILGACMFMPKDLLDRLGGFDERFVLYAEDTDLCYRIKAEGKKVVYVPNVEIVHLYQRTGARAPFSKASFLQVYTALLFYAKNYWRVVR